MRIHAIEQPDRPVAFSEREEVWCARGRGCSSEQSYSDSTLALSRGFLGRAGSTPTRNGRHHAVAAIDLRIVERSLVNAALEIIRHEQRGTPPKKRSIRTMRADPVGQRLREGRLGIGVAEAPSTPTKISASFTTPCAGRRLRSSFRIIDEHLRRDMMLAITRAKVAARTREQIADRL